MTLEISRRDFLAGATASLSLTSGPAFAGSEQVLTGPAFGGGWRAVFGPDTPAEKVAATIRSVIDQIDGQMSPYRADSDLTRFNVADSADWIDMPGPVVQIAARAKQLFAETGGAFDPTIGPVVGRFGFGPIKGTHSGPETLTAGDGGLRKDEAGLTLDLCGLAKGHALDLVMDRLAQAGIANAMVELGGEVRAAGHHPDGRRWRIGLEIPGADAPTIRHVIAPGERAIATSGHAAQGATGAFGSTSHIIDPRTGRPADMRLASVTVLDRTAERADGLATALAVMGPEDGPTHAEAHHIAALFLVSDERGLLREILTGDMAPHLLT